ncbi:MAG: helix-turn-helix domain-containing protein [Methanoregula sp.]|nr:MAG: helix-turn-helix domain-containing protein [Methanoregula sp.]
MADQVVLLEPGAEQATRIAKAMASRTAGDILKYIGDGQKTSTEISEHLSIPMNTAKYHIENLLDAGLISVAATKYSVKGREVKVYMLTNQLLIVAPRQTNIRSLLLKYTSLFAIVAFGSLVVIILESGIGTTGRLAEGMNTISGAPSPAVGVAYAKGASDMIVASQPFALNTPGAFFLGGAVVIAALFCYEVYVWRKRK